MVLGGHEASAVMVSPTAMNSSLSAVITLRDGRQRRDALREGDEKSG
jgi:hypothetical protein